MEGAKLIILGLLDGKLGLPLIKAAKHWGREIVPVTNGNVAGSGATNDIRELLPDLQIVYPAQFDEQLAPLIDDRTILVDASLESPHGHLVERFAGFGAPLILLSESASIRQEVVRDQVAGTIAKYRDRGMSVSVLQAPGYTQEGYSEIARLASLPNYAFQGTGVAIELMSSGPCHLYYALREQLRRLQNGEPHVCDYSSQHAFRELWEDIPREYHSYFQRVSYRVERNGSSRWCKLEFRGPQVFVEDFYGVLLPRFEKALEQNTDKEGLGLVRPEALPVK